ncbi:Ldh family oxidoreductase [Dongia sedimenti]|uniref:Ldh family oxidoreductase n=1 Tax=Dongia sedimenti TaxID=3064282 RepID=A0ABU0YF63_9PROT|nr:Ldh family oxidoreductase [Rhodospirillaceae bacterium R-7]
MLIPFDALVAKIAALFRANGCTDPVAAVLADNCAGAERDGCKSHGLFRIPGYVASLRCGWVDGAARPRIEVSAPGLIRVDGANGFAQPALAEVRARAAATARSQGIVLVAIRNAHHFSALAPDVEPFAEDGLLAIAMVNSNCEVAPFGGRKAVFGTDPMAFAAPRSGHPPLVFDQATSVVANGEVRLAARRGEDLAPGTGIDRAGNPTGDPKAILDGGALLPFAGHKGNALLIMIEILCAAIGGGRFSHEIDRTGFESGQTANTGQTLIVIDPTAGGGALPDFVGRVESLLSAAREAGQERFPGDRRLACRRDSYSRGIEVSQETMDSIEALSQTDPARSHAR